MTLTDGDIFLDPSDRNVVALMARQISGPITMLNLLRLRETADYLIGPEGQGWDLVIMVRQKSLEDFLSFASNDGYLKGVGHRTAAVWDSRILPLVDAVLPFRTADRS